jgi:hypothetical protein
MTGDDELRFARQRQWSDLRPCDAAAALAQPADRSPGGKPKIEACTC